MWFCDLTHVTGSSLEFSVEVSHIMIHVLQNLAIPYISILLNNSLTVVSLFRY